MEAGKKTSVDGHNTPHSCNDSIAKQNWLIGQAGGISVIATVVAESRKEELVVKACIRALTRLAENGK